MFEYLDVSIRTFLKKLKLEELYDFSKGTNDADFPLLIKWANHDLFWSDLCRSRFGIRPYRANLAKQFFHAECLFKCGEHDKAVAANSYFALKHFLELKIEARDFEKATFYGDKLFVSFGLVGRIHQLQLYLTALQTCDENHERYAAQGLEIIHLMEEDDDATEEYRFYYLSLGWQEKINPHFGDLQGFIETNKDFFQQHLPQTMQSEYH